MRRFNWYDMISYVGFVENSGSGFEGLFIDITIHNYNIKSIKNWWL
jgi:hypothetical protein